MAKKKKITTPEADAVKLQQAQRAARKRSVKKFGDKLAKLTHERMVRLLRNWLVVTQKRPVVATELASGGFEIPDALAFDSRGWTWLYECKASRSDFLKDRKKPHRQDPRHGVGQERWYVAPFGLLDPSEIPDPWGLLEIMPAAYTQSGFMFTKTKPAAHNLREDAIDLEVMRNDYSVLYSIARRTMQALSQLSHITSNIDEGDTLRGTCRCKDCPDLQVFDADKEEKLDNE